MVVTVVVGVVVTKVVAMMDADGADGGGAGASSKLRSHWISPEAESRSSIGRPVVAINCRPMVFNLYLEFEFFVPFQF